MPLTYQDLLNHLKTLSQTELAMTARVGIESGFLSIKKIFYIDESEATDISDFEGQTLVMDTQ